VSDPNTEYYSKVLDEKLVKDMDVLAWRFPDVAELIRRYNKKKNECEAMRKRYEPTMEEYQKELDEYAKVLGT
jgi:hypothetical protein